MNILHKPLKCCTLYLPKVNKTVKFDFFSSDYEALIVYKNRNVMFIIEQILLVQFKYQC